MPVGQLLKRTSGLEIVQWQAFERVYGPVGVETRVDMAAARTMARLTNIFQPRPNGVAYEPDDFMPRWDVRPVEGYDIDDRTNGDSEEDDA